MLAFLLWLVVVEVIGLAALPLALALLPRLPDRGYGLAKVLGILLVTYLNYLFGSLFGLGNSVALLALGLLVLFAVGLALLRGERAELGDWLRAHRAIIGVEEAIFLLLFAAWTLFRAAHPGILSTEKPMDLAMMTASHKATSFPPYDPWLAGKTINYYYGGYLAMGTLVTLTGVAPAIGFNLALALLFALVGVAAYSVAYGLMRDARWALLGPIAVLLMGNLDGLGQLFDPAHGISGFDFFRGSRIVEPALCNNSYCTITEFPAFSFLQSDLHPHVIALPFTILIIGVALNLALAPVGGWSGLAADNVRRVLTLLLAGIAAGALYFFNSWDWPTYTLLIGAALLLPGLAGRTGDGPIGPIRMRPLGEGVGLAVGVLALSYLLYISFRLGFNPQYATFGVKAHGSPTGQVLLMFGLFLLPIAAFTLEHCGRRDGVAAVEKEPAASGAAAVAEAKAAKTKGAASRDARSRTAVLERGNGDSGDEEDEDDELPRLPTLSLGRVFGRGGVDTMLLVLLSAVVCLGVFKVAFGLGTAGFLLPFLLAALYLAWREASAEQPVNAFALLLCAGGIALIMLCDVVFLKDNFCGPDATGACTSPLYRMNTVFKFYYQAWTVLALGGAYSLYYLSTRLRDGWRRFVAPGAAVLTLAGGTYLLLGAFSPPSVNAYFPTTHNTPTLTLDGSAYLDAYSGQPISITNAIPADAAAIRWLRANVPGHPTILEADWVRTPGYAPGPQDYWPFPGYPNQELMMSRISVFTGLPTVLGWGYSHEGLWHGDAVVAQRFTDVTTMYTSTNPGVVGALLRRYNVGYIYVGLVEAYSYYGNDTVRVDAAIARFKRFGTVAYTARGVTIIRTSIT